jgi:hypothetical protein
MQNVSFEKISTDENPDLFFAGNVSNARTYRTGTEGNNAARDVGRSDNTACLKLQFVEGLLFGV